VFIHSHSLRYLFFIGVFLLPLNMCITSCRTFPLLDLTGKDDGQVIALQPFTGYDTTGMYLLQTAIGQFYNRKVVVLAPIKLQPSWFVPVTEAYCADSIIASLSKLRKGKMVEVIGLTSSIIFTEKHYKEKPYFDNRIIGLGYQPGTACIISDYRIHSFYADITRQRLRRAVIHEVGHNMGLPHCHNEECVMNVKNLGDDYCKECRKQLGITIDNYEY